MYEVGGLLKVISNKQQSKSGKSASSKKSHKIIELYLQNIPEDQIAKILYGDIESANFRKLKSRMIDILATTILKNVDEIEFRNLYYQKLFSVQKLVLIGNLLILKDHRHTAVPLLKKAFRISLEIEYAPYIIQSGRLLCQGAIYSDKKSNFEMYKKTVAHYIKLYTLELEIELEYSSILKEIIAEAEYTLSAKRNISNLMDRVKIILKKNNSYTLQLYFYLISVRYFHSLFEFHNVRITCQRAISFLISKPILFQNIRAGEFSLHEMESCLRLNQFKAAKECAQRCARYFMPYTTNWSIFYEYYFLLAMRTGNYTKANEIAELIKKSQYKLAKMSPIRLERWKIYDAYLSLVFTTSNIKKFNLYKYLNEINILQKDKPGYHFSVLISKILLLLFSRNENELINLEESLTTYLRRYIKFEDHPRHFLFGKYIKALLKCDIKKINSSKTLSQLRNVPTLEETEIIPYDNLIEFIEKNLVHGH